MCFYIHNKHKEQKAATKDILCYKVLNGLGKKTFYSPFRVKRYDLSPGKSFKSKLVIPYEGAAYINVGLHSYTVAKKARAIRKNWDDGKIMQFVIPKGTRYYFNPAKKEYVSAAIKFKKIIK